MTTAADFPFADSVATKMLANAIHGRQLKGTSLRKTAAELGYRQAVVLSHMSTGRVPIPIERAPQFAKHLGMNERQFLLAVLEQRMPDIAWSEMFGTARPKASDTLAERLETIIGKSLDDLTDDQKYVMREVAGTSAPMRRWLSVHELPLVEMIREHTEETGVDTVQNWLGPILAYLK